MTHLQTIPLPPPSRYARWSNEEDAILQDGFRVGTPSEILALQLGRSVKSIEVRAALYGVRRQTRCPQLACDLGSLVAVADSWDDYPQGAQDAFLARIGAVRCVS